jgi:hypothetical protein
MDWALSITTLLVNAGLGWTRGAWWMWIVHSVNGAAWIIYASIIGQYGLIIVGLGTVIIDIPSAIRAYRKSKK